MRWCASTSDAAGVAAQLDADLLGELVVHVRAERRIDAVEGVMAVGGLDDDAVLVQRDAARTGRRPA